MKFLQTILKPVLVGLLLTSASQLPCLHATNFISNAEVYATQSITKSKVANKKKSTKSSKSTKQTKGQNTTNSKSQGTKGSGATRRFEGQLMYVTNEYANKMAKFLSLGTLFNGSRTYFITIKGDEMDLYDATLHNHQIIKPRERKAILYSELTGEGVIIAGDYFDEMYNAYNDNGIKAGDKLFKRKVESSVAKQTRFYNGDNCHVLTGIQTVAEEGDTPMSETRGELWTVPQLKVGDILKSLYGGFNPGEVVKKGILNTQSKIPILGTLKIQNAFELIGINERPVKSSELNPPANIKLTEAKSGSMTLFKYNRNHNKALKKAGLKVKEIKADEVKKEIAKKWEFAHEWDAYSIKPPKNDFTVWQFAENIASGIMDAKKRMWEQDGTPTDAVYDRRMAQPSDVDLQSENDAQTEEEKEAIRKKNKELTLEHFQKQYDREAETLKKKYDNYKDVHKNDVKRLKDELKKEGKISGITRNSVSSRYLSTQKSFNQQKRLMLHTYDLGTNYGIKQHRYHDLKFDFENPTSIVH